MLDHLIRSGRSLRAVAILLGVALCFAAPASGWPAAPDEPLYWIDAPSQAAEMLALKQSVEKQGGRVLELAPEGRVLVSMLPQAAQRLAQQMPQRRIEALSLPPVESAAPAQMPGLGEVPPTAEQRAGLQRVSSPAAANELSSLRAALDGLDGVPPASVDNSLSQYFPPIRSQGSQGSCTAWATGYYYATYTQAMDENLVVSGGDNDHIASPAFIYPLINGGADNGASTVQAMMLLNTTGCASWTLKPYSALDYTSWPSEEAWIEALNRRTQSTFSIGTWYAGCDDDDLIAIKQHLANGNILATRTDVYSNWYPSLNNANDGVDSDVVYASVGSNVGGHAMTIVGYDDNKEYNDGTGTRTGAFLIANSWGSSWGAYNSGGVNRGYMWVAYDYFKADNDCFGVAYYNDDRDDYRPELYACAGLNHASRLKLGYRGGVGTPGSPDWSSSYVINGSGGDYAINDTKRVAVDLTDGAASISDPSNVSLFVQLNVQASAAESGTITSADFYYDFDGDGMFSCASSSDPVVTVGAGATDYATVSFASDYMQVSPAEPQTTEKLIGEPFSPASFTYQAANSGAADLDWSVAVDAPWLDIAGASSGTLGAGGDVSVQFDLNAQADALEAGEHTATLTFTNVTSGDMQTRTITAQVYGPPANAVYYFPLNTDPGWTATGQWEFGEPLGNGGAVPYPDPDAAASGSNVFGVNLSGDYSLEDIGYFYLTAGPFDFSVHQNVQLEYKRWLNTDFYPYADALVEVSTDGSAWQAVWQTPRIEEVFMEDAWADVAHDISAIADGQPEVYVRWGYAVAAEAFSMSGWNIDDIALTATEGDTWTLSSSATAGGSVAAAPDKTLYIDGETVELTALPLEGYDFTGWTGDVPAGDELDNPLALLMNADKSVQAVFQIRSHTLALSATNGSVAADPDQAAYAYGTIVSLTPVPDAHHHFVSWTGDIPAGQDAATPLEVTMNADKTIAALFAIDRHTLGITAENGSVARDPDQADYAYGETVSLAATPALDHRFTGWSGDVEAGHESDNPLDVAMTADKAITANFEALPVISASAPDATACEDGVDCALIRLARTGGLGQPLDVVIQCSGTAQAGNDYSTIASPVTFAAGEDTCEIEIVGISDTLAEGDETVILTIQASDDYVVGTPDAATVTIQNVAVETAARGWQAYR